MTETGGLRWRTATEADVSEIFRISKIIHADIPERIETYREKITLSPKSCFAAVDGKAIRGYAIALPWMANEIPELDTLLGALPPHASALCIHDVALLPSARGQGLVEELMKLLDEAARRLGLHEIALAAVYGSEVSWYQYGFRRAEMSEKLKAQVATYGSAVFMKRPVAAA